MKCNDREMIDELVQDLLPELYRLAFYLSRNRLEAEDAVQESLARMLQARETEPRRIRDPRAWCVTVLSRLCSARRRRPASAELHPDTIVDTREPRGDLMAAELRELVHRALAELPDDEREAICLNVFGELTIRELARATGVPRSTAHLRVRRAIDRLRRRLGPAVEAGLVPPALIQGDIPGFLAGLPSPEVPESLVAEAARLVSGSFLASGSASVASSTLPLGVLVIMKSKLGILVASTVLSATLGLGIMIGGTMAREEPGRLASESSARQPARLRPEGDLEGGVSGAGGGEKGVAPTRPEGAVVSTTIDRLLAAALEAFRSKDAPAFRASFLALLDAGRPARAALIELARMTGGYNRMLAALEPEDEGYASELIHPVTARRRELGWLVDAILSRDASPDSATEFAYDLMGVNGVAPERPLAEHAADLLELLERSIEEEGESVEWNDLSIQAAHHLGKTRSADSLPRLGSLLERTDISERNRIEILRAVARIGGEEAVAALRKVRDAASPTLRGHLMRNLAMYDYGNPEVDAFLRETLELETDASNRGSMQRSLEQREGARELADRLGNGAIEPRERMQILETLLERGGQEELQIAWKDLEAANAEIQDEVLPSFANRDARAMELILGRLRSDPVSGELSNGMQRIDAKVVDAHRGGLEQVAGDASLPARNRAAAAGALAKVDPSAAARLLAIGFDGAGEADRLEIVGALRHRIAGREAEAILQAIAASDPTETVRAAAAREP